MVEALANLSEFYAHESCGQCSLARRFALMAKALRRLTLAREGNRTRITWSGTDNIPGGRTICAFGEACSWPVQSFVAKFKDEFVARGAADEARRASMQPDSASENEAVVTHP